MSAWVRNNSLAGWAGHPILTSHPSKSLWHGSLNVPIEHHPTIRYMVYNGYYKVMSNIPKMGQLPTPVWWRWTMRWTHPRKKSLAAFWGLRQRFPSQSAEHLFQGLLGISQFLRFQNHIRSWKLGIAATGFLGWDGGDLHQLLRERCQRQTASYKRYKLPISAHSLQQVQQVQDSWIINLACSYADLWPGVPA